MGVLKLCCFFLLQKGTLDTKLSTFPILTKAFDYIFSATCQVKQRLKGLVERTLSSWWWLQGFYLSHSLPHGLLFPILTLQLSSSSSIDSGFLDMKITEFFLGWWSPSERTSGGRYLRMCSIVFRWACFSCSIERIWNFILFSRLRMLSMLDSRFCILKRVACGRKSESV